MGRIKTFIRNINYLSKHSLWDQREEDIIYLSSKIVDDCKFEYNLTSPFHSIKILSKEESLNLILQSKKSFVRTGDGEIKMTLGMDQPFQKYEKEIDEGLRTLLAAERDDILVGLNANYFRPLSGIGNPHYYRRWAYDYRHSYYQFINETKEYIDATVTGFDLASNDYSAYEKQYETWKQAFSGKNIAIVCGRTVLDGLEYDVFELANSKQFIYGPNKNAWDVHDQLIETIRKNVNRSTLIVFILGMAGKVMIPELVDAGYTCWDVGHLAKYYDAFKKRRTLKQTEIDIFYAPD